MHIDAVMADDAVLEVSGLKTYYRMGAGRELRAVDDISFALRPGRTLCIVGESGSGKSVTARSILQLISPPGRIVGGKILFRPAPAAPAIDLAALDPRGSAVRAIRGRAIGMVFQEPMTSLSPLHRIGRQIAESLVAHRLADWPGAERRAVDLLRQVEIAAPERAAQRYPFEFSGGMRQRAMIAMALACEPRVLIADEPTTALDVTTQAEILRLLARLRADHGMAVLFITHDMGVVAQIADDVAVMYRGRIVEQGSRDRVLTDPQHEYTKRLLAAAKQLSLHAASAAPPKPGQRVVLSVRDVSLTYPARGGLLRRTEPPKPALHKVSLDLFEGENLGIVGESGSGKTTLASCVMRVLQPDTGSIAYRTKDGATPDLVRLRQRELGPVHAEMRFVFQDPFASLNPRMTVEQVIGEPLRNRRLLGGPALRDRVRELLDLVGLPPDAASRYPHAFSGGQRQRIAIARALAPNPRVVIADEPTSALDVTLRGQILDLLLSLQRTLGLSYILVSHDLGAVRYFCNRIAVMRGGQIVEAGTAEQICTAPTHDYTRALIAAVLEP